MKKLLFLFAFLSISAVQAQEKSDAFLKMTENIKNFKPNFSAPPNDELTAMVAELRKLKGNFNVQTILEMKLAEMKAKKEIPEAELTKMTAYFEKGEGVSKLNNAVTWLYRDAFSKAELQDLIVFFQSPTGHKYATQFPEIVLKSVATAETLQQAYQKSKP